MVAFHHVRQELLRQIVVRKGVHFERQIQVALGGVEDSFAAGNAGVVDQDCRVAERAANLRGGVFDGGGRGKVAVEEADGGGCWRILVNSRFVFRGHEDGLTCVGWLLYIQHCNLDSPLRQQMNDYLSNSIASTSNNDNFLTPDVRVVGPIVRYCIIEPSADFVCEPEHEERLEVLPCGCMISSYTTTIECVSSCQEKRESNQRVQRRELQQTADGVACHACTPLA